MTDQVTIIGAGITGIACARHLHRAGLKVRVIDKGRNIGGRMSTRRTRQGLQFDHGAQDLATTDPDFAQMLRGLGGAVAPWADRGPVGSPGMSDVVRAMARDLDVTQGAMVAGLRRGDAGWQIAIDDIWQDAGRVALAIPAPQARDLLGADHPFAEPLAKVAYDPCVTLMAGLSPDAPQPFRWKSGTGAAAWIAHDGSKPDRQGQPLATWVMQADPDFSAQHIDVGFDQLACMMAPVLLDQLGAASDHLQYASAHRWLYSRVSRPLGQPFLADDGNGLLAGGDWALGPTARDGWASGTAMAAHLLADG
ncbi:NAD(P)/FAD-dependent oxidoreductase [Paracoccus sp. R86501]|uniref:NAD(P)/FAD-dependent oxidoreductase n=1 Tax=Paracoccus sp. R86501 TaxID=3101711 RepID=UPI00366D11F8